MPKQDRKALLQSIQVIELKAICQSELRLVDRDCLLESERQQGGPVQQACQKIAPQIARLDGILRTRPPIGSIRDQRRISANGSISDAIKSASAVRP